MHLPAFDWAETSSTGFIQELAFASFVIVLSQRGLAVANYSVEPMPPVATRMAYTTTGLEAWSKDIRFRFPALQPRRFPATSPQTQTDVEGKGHTNRATPVGQPDQKMLFAG